MNYPDWICSECAEANNGRWPDNHIGTFHKGICGWCNEKKDVTQPRDYKYPIFSKEKE